MKRQALVFVIIIIGILAIFAYRLKIRNISCTSQYGPCNAQLAKDFENVERRQYLQVQKDVKRILQANPQIEKFSLHFELSDTLEVNVIEKKADVAFIGDGTDTYEIVDSEGKTLGRSTETQLPKIVVKNAQLSDNQKKFTGALLKEMYRVYGIRLGRIDGDGMTVETALGPVVIFPLEGDIDLLLGKMQFVLSWLNSTNQGSTIEGLAGDRVKVIDLRYKNPVLR